MPRIKLTIEYDGSRFVGWQYQKNGLSIQQAIEDALKVLFKQNIRVVGSGRTDAGVHAKNQVAHADIPHRHLTGLKRSLNGLLPKDIVIKTIAACSADFHARYSAITRRYRYYIANQPTAIYRSFAWSYFYPLNLVLMGRGAEIIRQNEDFQAFCKVTSEVNHYRCSVVDSHFEINDGLIVYEIAANRFLHGMVRAITGTLVALGNGKISLHDLRKLFASQDRTKVPLTAPARGLFLQEIVY
ncbi:MAG: tRNA pseudouridine(38-40) synthase TruA [Caldithrix sp.]|nr:tRNA pseudouridine(38-40) synthase TruA [Caldithrix sp.]